ncbi:MAG: hypothetical protein WAW33_01180 [Minisyncoccia bacterium]
MRSWVQIPPARQFKNTIQIGVFLNLKSHQNDGSLSDPERILGNNAKWEALSETHGLLKLGSLNNKVWSKISQGSNIL